MSAGRQFLVSSKRSLHSSFKVGNKGLGTAPNYFGIHFSQLMSRKFVSTKKIIRMKVPTMQQVAMQFSATDIKLDDHKKPARLKLNGSDNCPPISPNEKFDISETIDQSNIDSVIKIDRHSLFPQGTPDYVIESFNSMDLIKADPHGSTLIITLAENIKSSAVPHTVSQLCMILKSLSGLTHLYPLEVSASLITIRNAMVIAVDAVNADDASCGVAALRGILKFSRSKADIIAWREIMKLLLPHIERSDDVFLPRHIKLLLKGGEELGSTESVIRNLYGIVADKIMNCPVDFEPDILFDCFGLLSAVFGSRTDGRRVVSALTKRLRNSAVDAIYPSDVEKVLKGIHRMGSVWPEVREAVGTLADLLERCQWTFKIEELAANFFQLHNMESKNVEVRRLIKELLRLAPNPYKTSDISKLATHHICNLLYGIKMMEADCNEVKDVLKYATLCIQLNKRQWSGGSISKCIFALQNMCNKSAPSEINALLAAIRSHSSAKSIWCSKDFAMLSYGLQHMTFDSLEVQKLVSLLCSRFTSSNEDISSLSGVTLGNILFGLRGFTSHEDVGNLYNHVMNILDKIAFFRGKSVFLTVGQLRELYRSLVLTELYIDSSLIELKSRANLLAKFIHRKKLKQISTHSDIPGSYSAKVMEDAIRQLFKPYKSDVAVESNKYIRHFEADIIIYINKNSDTKKMHSINIEVDGFLHDVRCKRSFDIARDLFLRQACDIIVVRMNPCRAEEISTIDDFLKKIKECSKNLSDNDYLIVEKMLKRP